MYDKTFSTVIDRREMLRVKLKNLAQEAALIRKEENRILWCKARIKEFSFALEDAVLNDATPADLRLLRGLRKAQRRVVGDYGLYLELHGHRVGRVRGEARRAHLAYGAIRGRTLEQMEGAAAVLLPEDKKEVLRMFKAYGARGAEVPAWLQATTPVEALRMVTA